MAGGSPIESRVDGHGDVFARDLGAMIVHIQRESGLAHRTFVFRPWQVHVVRAAASRWAWFVAAVMLVSWAFLAFQAVRVPLLRTRISQMENDALRLDTLQQALKGLQARYEQVQSMLSRPAQPAATKLRPVPNQEP
jgi:hypothetical protein